MAEILAHSPAHIISRLLIDRGLATEPEGSLAWPAFVGNEPDKPDNCITVRDTQGRSFGFSQVDGVRLDHYGFQIRVRGITHTVGWTKARAIALALDSDIMHDVVTIDAVDYLVESVTRSSDVISLGREQQARRNLFTINATVVVGIWEGLEAYTTFTGETYTDFSSSPYTVFS